MGDTDRYLLAREAHLRLILSLRKLLLQNKEAVRNKIVSTDNKLDTYKDIHYVTDIREATISDTFNGKTVPNAVTLLLIIEGMGYSLNDFTTVYNSVTEKEIRKLNKEIPLRNYF